MSSESESENPTVTDEELSREIKNQLEAAHYKDLTLRTVRKSLEDKFKIDLVNRKPFIKAETTRYLQEYRNKTQEEKPAKPSKRAAQSSDEEAEPTESIRKVSVMKLDDGLADICGGKEMTRNEVLKKVWAYIRSANLQDANDKKLYHLDDKLKSVFGVSDIKMVEVNSLLSAHLTATNKKVEVTVASRKKSTKEPKGKASKEKKTRAPKLDENGNKIVKQTGLNKPLRLSPEMSEFVGESNMSRPQVVRKLGEYIKENKLQDPENRKNIKCDKKLSDLLGVSEVTGFSMNKYISKHFMKD